MTFEEFLEDCSVDFSTDGDKTDVIVIFSSAIMKEFSTEFATSGNNGEICKRILARDLYDILAKSFNE